MPHLSSTIELTNPVHRVVGELALGCENGREVITHPSPLPCGVVGEGKMPSSLYP